MLDVDNTIETMLQSPDLEREWQGCLSAWENSLPAQRADCRASVVSLRDQFLRVLTDVNDAQEREVVTAIFYVLIKSKWILINTQIGYQILSDNLDEALICRAGLLSAMVGRMEPHLGADNVDRITAFISMPLASDGDGAIAAENLGRGLSTRHDPAAVVYAPPPTTTVTLDVAEATDNRIALLHQSVGTLNQEVARLQSERASEKEALYRLFGTSNTVEINGQLRRFELEKRELEERLLENETAPHHNKCNFSTKWGGT